MVGLSFMYYWGKGVKKDRNKAAELDKRAAALGNRKGQFNLGRDYEDGTGVPKDYKQAVYWYFKAAENGDPMAMERLYEAYHLNRLGLKRDDEKAHYWAEKARETRRKTGEVDPRSLSVIEKVRMIWF